LVLCRQTPNPPAPYYFDVLQAFAAFCYVITATKTFTGLAAFALAMSVLFSAGQSVAPGREADLKRLQGYWEGEGAGGKCTITITNNTLHYRAGNGWFMTKFTLPDKTSPQQLHATITDSAPPTNSIGTVVHAIFKIEGDVLTLATIDINETPLQDFTTARERYIVRKTTPPPKNSKSAGCNPQPRAASRETNLLDSLFKFPIPTAPISPGAK
jgi:hypothetical protein